MTVSPTQRSLARLRAEGWTAEVTEHWNPHARIRQDLFGFVDILAVRGKTECPACLGEWWVDEDYDDDPIVCEMCQAGVIPAATLAVQCTTSSNLAARVKKIADHPNLPAVREAGWQVEVWGWSYSRRERRWVCRVVDVS